MNCIAKFSRIIGFLAPAKTLVVCSIAALGLTMAEHAGAQAPALEFAPGTGYGVANNWSIGWEFTTNQPVTVDALSAYFADPGGNQVRLYDSSGITLSSATILPTDPTEGSPTSFLTAPVAPVNLSANQTYFVAEDFNAMSTLGQFLVSGLTTNPAISYDTEVSGLTGQNPTADNIFHGAYVPGIFGPNLSITATPEPGTLALFATSSLGMVGLMARKRRRK